jgi:hypothetical protein
LATCHTPRHSTVRVTSRREQRPAETEHLTWHAHCKPPETMSRTHGRWVLFLSGVVCAIWLLAIHAFVDQLLRDWPDDPRLVTEPCRPCAHGVSTEAATGGTWKLRTRHDLPPITATTLPLDEGRWGLLLCGVHQHDVLFDMGFRDGDILVEVDGRRSSSSRAALASFGRILADEVRHVEVSRSSHIVTIDIQASRRAPHAL